MSVLSFRQVRPQVWGLPIRWWINKAKEDLQLFQALPAVIFRVLCWVVVDSLFFALVGNGFLLLKGNLNVKGGKALLFALR